MTSLTRRSTGAMPLLTSQRPGAWRDGHPRRPNRSKHRHENIRVQPWWPDQKQAAKWAVYGGALEYLSFHQGTSRIHRRLMKRPPRCVGTNREQDRLWHRSWDHEGRSNFDVAKG